ncbi:cytochrome P450 [Streptomyces oceani]|uniref:Cytochrome n=1 Tax=Streptomyces oceani TaxID=1075402 RepID=A0A1E7JVX9_9ACTN|nr:cytochrome P450 [Streptomyces oceani]OEU95470.1 cytochrome [Streptomyces oceani]
MTEAVSFPQDRSCPYHPPTGHRPLAEAGPITRAKLYDGREVWIVTGHAEARQLLTDERLSSVRENPAFPVTSERFEAIPLEQRSTPLLGTDGTKHHAQRRMLLPRFTNKRVAELRPRIQQVVDELLDDMIEKGRTADLATDFALPLSSNVICALLGVPYSDHAFFEKQSSLLLRATTGEESAAAAVQLMTYMGELVARKEQEPGDDLLDTLVEHLRAGELERQELVSLAIFMLIAGHESTANMITLGTLTLLEHPEQFAALRADESLYPGAVDELLRFLAIVEGLARVATEEIEIGEVVIRPDEAVLFATSLINRDPAVYPDPDELDLTRSARQHVTFGYGIHLCLGHNLGRVEMEVALRTLFTRLPDLHLATPVDQLTFSSGDTIQGPVSLPVAW